MIANQPCCKGSGVGVQGSVAERELSKAFRADILRNILPTMSSCHTRAVIAIDAGPVIPELNPEPRTLNSLALYNMRAANMLNIID